MLEQKIYTHHSSKLFKFFFFGFWQNFWKTTAYDSLYSFQILGSWTRKLNFDAFFPAILNVYTSKLITCAKACTKFLELVLVGPANSSRIWPSKQTKWRPKKTNFTGTLFIKYQIFWVQEMIVRGNKLNLLLFKIFANYCQLSLQVIFHLPFIFCRFAFFSTISSDWLACACLVHFFKDLVKEDTLLDI